MRAHKGLKRKGLTPVISTLILVSVTLTISVSTAFWMKSAEYAYTGFEKLAYLSANPSYDYPSRLWTISVDVKNIGTKPSQIVQVFVNEVELSSEVKDPTPGNGGVDLPRDGVRINQGTTATLKIYLKQGGQSQPFSELVGAQTLFIKIVTDEGVEYFKICELCPPAA